MKPFKPGELNKRTFGYGLGCAPSYRVSHCRCMIWCSDSMSNARLPSAGGQSKPEASDAKPSGEHVVLCSGNTVQSCIALSCTAGAGAGAGSGGGGKLFAPRQVATGKTNVSTEYAHPVLSECSRMPRLIRGVVCCLAETSRTSQTPCLQSACLLVLAGSLIVVGAACCCWQWVEHRAEGQSVSRCDASVRHVASNGLIANAALHIDQAKSSAISASDNSAQISATATAPIRPRGGGAGGCTSPRPAARCEGLVGTIRDAT